LDVGEVARLRVRLTRHESAGLAPSANQAHFDPPGATHAKTHTHRDDHAELVVTCAPSGSGKSHWIKQNLPDHQPISLVAIREEITGRHDA